MKPSDSDKRECGWLRALLRNYQKAMQSPEITRAILYARESFQNEHLRFMAVEIVLADGNWEKAKAMLFHMPGEVRKSLIAWAERVLHPSSRPKVRARWPQVMKRSVLP